MKRLLMTKAIVFLTLLNKIPHLHVLNAIYIASSFRRMYFVTFCALVRSTCKMCPSVRTFLVKLFSTAKGRDSKRCAINFRFSNQRLVMHKFIFSNKIIMPLCDSKGGILLCSWGSGCTAVFRTSVLPYFRTSGHIHVHPHTCTFVRVTVRVSPSCHIFTITRIFFPNFFLCLYYYM